VDPALTEVNEALKVNCFITCIGVLMRFGWARVIFIMLITLSAVHSQRLMEWGDGGEVFANETAPALCDEKDVQAVYVCNGNVVRVVSTISGQGSTFYKPDGIVVSCPVLPPTDIGMECLQLLMPNFCQAESICGNTSEQIFPAEPDSPELTGDEDYYIIEGQSAADEPEEVEPEVIPEPEPVVQPPKKVANLDEMNEEDIPAMTPTGFDAALDNLLWGVMFLGAVVVGLLFVLFKKSVNEEL
jgi:hypothetical protein